MMFSYVDADHLYSEKNTYMYTLSTTVSWREADKICADV